MAALAAALALAFAGGAGGDLVVPAWDAPTPHDEVCVEVPKTLTSPYANNSRWGFVALPRGVPPAGGWPVLITLAIIDFAANASATAANGGRCGLDGVYPERGGGRSYAMTEEYAPFAPPNEPKYPGAHSHQVRLFAFFREQVLHLLLEAVGFTSSYE